MKTLILDCTGGKSYQFEMTDQEIEKQIMALESVETNWFLIKNVRIRPSHIVAIKIK